MRTDRPFARIAFTITVAGLAVATPVWARDAIDQALSENGKMQYERYCTSCHGPGGAPGSGSKADLRGYVARHGGKFPAARWLAIIADTQPGNVHTAVWESIRKDQGTSNVDVSARAIVGQIARYVISIQGH